MPNPGSQRVESKPYRPPRRRAKVLAGIPRGGHRSGPRGVVGGGALRSRTKLSPFVGRKLTGGGAKALPPAQRRLPRKADSPTTQPRGLSEPRSRQYVAAKRRTKSKARLFNPKNRVRARSHGNVNTGVRG